MTNAIPFGDCLDEQGDDDASRTRLVLHACHPTPQQAVEMTLRSIINALWTNDDTLRVTCAEDCASSLASPTACTSWESEVSR